jgi:sugar phosphate isomerase/epimerase
VNGAAMPPQSVTFSVFTKPWKTTLAQLGQMVADLGFDGIELPVRPGYQVEPERVRQDLPAAVNQLGAFGVKVNSVAATPTEAVLAACAEQSIPIVRVMVPIGEDGYTATEGRTRTEFDALLPLLERYGVTLGIQNHSGPYICNAMGLCHLLAGYDPRFIGAVWDPAHNALNGEDPELGIDIVWPHLCMVNLKNAFWRRSTGPEAEDVRWRPYWTSGRQGLASWPRVAAELKRRSYGGTLCLSAEYTDEGMVTRLIAEDIAFARSLFV